MFFYKRLLNSVSYFVFYFSVALGFAQTEDMKVQHIQDDIGNGGGINSSITAVSSLNSAFVLANNNRKTHGGRRDLNAGNLDGDDMSGARVLTNLGELSYFRESGSIDANMRFSSSIWEYIGPVGGENEFIVRGRYQISLNGSTNSLTQALAGVLDKDKCIPFITGILNNADVDDADSGTALAYLENASTLRVQKGSNANNVTVFVTVVEFTGSNWTVLHGDSGNQEDDTGTIDLTNSADGAGSAVAISSWGKSIIFSHFRADNNDSGEHDAISDLWPVLEPGSSKNTVDWMFNGDHKSNGRNRHFVHVLSNPIFNVTRIQNSSNTAAETTVANGAISSSINEAIIVGSTMSSGEGRAYGKGWRNYQLNSSVEAGHWAHRSGNKMTHELQIVDFSIQRPIVLIEGDGNIIANGSSTPTFEKLTNFGDVLVGSNKSHFFTIRNIGLDLLELINPSDYITITGDVSQFTLSKIPSTPILSLGSTTFAITFSPTSVGNKTVNVSINCNAFHDANYSFDITGNGIDYCESNGADETYEYIQNVQLSTINNSSGAGSTSTGYSDFTSISTNLLINSTETISITPAWPNGGTVYNEGYSVWIDYNQNGDFSDAGEQVFSELSDSETGVSGSFTVPLSAELGITKMRVSMDFEDIPGECGENTYGEVEDYTINIVCESNEWTGAVDDDWNNELNWSCFQVPVDVSTVLIPASISTKPIIYDPDSFGTVENLEIENGASLTIFDNSIEVYGTLLLNGILDLQGEGQLIQTEGSILDAASSGSLERDQQGVGNSFNYNYWSSPVSNFGSSSNSGYKIEEVLFDGTDYLNPVPIDFDPAYTASDSGSTIPSITISSYWFYTFNGAEDDYNAWNSIDEKTQIEAGDGFTMKGALGGVAIGGVFQNYVFRGIPNNGDINLELGNGEERLIGNPYPSALDADEFIKDHIKETIGGGVGRNSVNVFNGALYFWDHFGEENSHELKDYEGGYATYTLIGGTEAYSTDERISDTGASGTKVPERHVPVGQGFFVQAVLDTDLAGETTTDVSGGTITFKNSQRIFVTEASGNSIFMKSSKKGAIVSKSNNSSSEDNRSKIRLVFSSNGFHRQILIGADENTSNSFDLGFDAPLADLGANDMFWKIGNGKFVIQGVPNFNEEQEFPIGLKIEKNGLAVIQLDKLENLDEGIDLYIKDNFTGKTHEINSNSFEIELEAGEYFDRFSLVFKAEETLSIANEILSNGIHIFMDNDQSQLKIRNTINKELNGVYLYNSLGQLLTSWNKDIDKPNLNLSINNKPVGVYIVQIKTKEGIMSKKIIIK